MTYSQLTTKLINKNFYRVAKDDRLLDIFPKESRAKGIELWEKIDRQNTTIIRVHEPQSIKSVTTRIIPTKDLEQALQNNQTLNLLSYPAH